MAIEDETEGVDDMEAEAGSLPFVVGDHEVTIPCQTGDRIEIYDVNGVLLESARPETEATFCHKGEGIRVLRINGSSYKVQL